MHTWHNVLSGQNSIFADGAAKLRRQAAPSACIEPNEQDDVRPVCESLQW
jgi:hypothetical protein